jgi:hypothetical protein
MSMLWQLERVGREAANVERAKEKFVAAMQQARDAGASTRQIGKAAGLSHQRVSQLTVPRRGDDGGKREPFVAFD